MQPPVFQRDVAPSEALTEDFVADMLTTKIDTYSSALADRFRSVGIFRAFMSGHLPVAVDFDPEMLEELYSLEAHEDKLRFGIAVLAKSVQMALQDHDVERVNLDFDYEMKDDLQPPQMRVLCVALPEAEGSAESVSAF